MANTALCIASYADALYQKCHTDPNDRYLCYATRRETTLQNYATWTDDTLTRMRMFVNALWGKKAPRPLVRKTLEICCFATVNLG